MKIKIFALFLLTAVIFQSCTSNDSGEDSLAEEEITTTLADKIITTATSLNDYNFFVNNATATSCDLLSITSGYFNTPEGDYFSFIFSNTTSFDMWLSQYNDAKLQAFNSTGVAFSDEDFFITYISNPTGFGGLSERESMLDYFENCVVGFGDTGEYGLPFTDISSNCDINTGRVTIFIYNDINTGGSVDNFTTTSLFSVENLLATYNTDHNTNYGLENLKIYSIPYVTPHNDDLNLATKKELINYFDNCMLSRDATEDDCLNFVYPLQVNSINAGLEDVIAINNDEDLAALFSTDTYELTFVFPINLSGANGTVLTIESNDALENALDTSASYCY